MTLIKFFRRRWVLYAVFVFTLLLSACDPPPQPAYLIFFLDSSASSAGYRQDAIANIRSICQALDFTIDKVSMYRLSDDLYNLYSGSPKIRDLDSVLVKYSEVVPSSKGTAYGAALQRGITEAKDAYSHGFVPVIIFLGDGADEKVAAGGNVDWDALKVKVKELPPKGLLAFLFINPKVGDKYRRFMGGTLGERLLLLDPILSRDHGGASKIKDLIKR